MTYHKKASFWILLSCLTYLPFNPQYHTSLLLIFPFSLFAFELFLDFKNVTLSKSLKSSEVDSELAELRVAYEKEGLRANIDNVSRQRALQDGIVAGKSPSKKDQWSW